MKKFKIFYVDEITHFKNEKILTTLQEKYDLVEIIHINENHKIPKNSPILRFGIREYFKSCLKRGGIIYLVFDKDTLIFRACVQKGPYVAVLSKEVGLFIENGACYVELCETHPSYRGQRIYPYILYKIHRRFVPLNYKIYVASESSNVASEKGILYAGFKLFSETNDVNTIKEHNDVLVIKRIDMGYFISYNFKKYLKIMQNMFV